MDWPRCCICHRELSRTEQARQACRMCERSIGEHLAALPGLYDDLDDHLAPAPGPREYTSGGPIEAPLPVNAAALSLQAAGGIATVLATWAADWHHVLGWDAPQLPAQPRAQLRAAVDILLRNLAWAVDQHPALAEFADEVRQLHAAAQRIVAPAELPHVVGRHPAEDGQAEPCGGRLEMRPGGTTVRCARCNAAWGPLQWLTLRRHLEAPATAHHHAA
ncbi:hypothetical protein ACWDRR_43400 [Kitasatospora sp. NPDC003701]